MQNATIGTVIATLNATDADAGVNSDITYSIVSGNTGGEFQLDSSTGVLTTAKKLDYEATPEYEVSCLLFVLVNGCSRIMDDLYIHGNHNFNNFSLKLRPIVAEYAFADMRNMETYILIKGLYELCHPISPMPLPSLVVRHICLSLEWIGHH